VNERSLSGVIKARLALVRQAGKQYTQTGETDETPLSESASPMIPEEPYAAIVTSGASIILYADPRKEIN